jgi:hypothetical protein
MIQQGGRRPLAIGCAVMALALVPLQAQAISRYSSPSLSCATIQSRIQSEGAVILRWTQPPDIQRYNRFVANSQFCDSGQTTAATAIPSADGQCGVWECKKPNPFFLPPFFDDNDNGPPRNRR